MIANMISNEKVDTEAVLICNICGSDRIEKLDPEFNFCRCGSCEYVFDSPRPSFTEISAFYSQAGKYDPWLKAEHARDLLWKRRLKKLLLHKSNGSLLDIGAGYGQFLHHARPFFSQVTGTEVSESAVALAKEKYGLNLLAGQVAELDLPPQSFDTITLFHVLEHVSNPAKLMSRCHAMLRPQGIVIIAVPNDLLAWTSKIKKLGRRLGIKSFQKFSPKLGISRAGTSREIHLSHFTPSVLRRLIENSGLRIIEESLDPYYVSRGVRLFLDSTYYAVHRVLHTSLKINRYDTIWMVARQTMNSLKELQRNWEGLAQADPLWVICTDPRKRNNQWTREEFFATGNKEIETVLGYAARIGICIDRTLPALDFGCGVGRLTRALTKYFCECRGVDISPTMITLAREMNHDLPNCRFQLSDDIQLKSLQDNYFGFIYTSLVLQHIAEPCSHQYIVELVRVLKPGGALIFQVPEKLHANSLTRFKTKLALRGRLQSILGRQKPCAMEMHCIKETAIRELMAQNGAYVVDVAITNSCDPSFSGDLQYLTQEPLQGYVSKQYCVIKH